MVVQPPSSRWMSCDIVPLAKWNCAHVLGEGAEHAAVDAGAGDGDGAASAREMKKKIMVVMDGVGDFILAKRDIVSSQGGGLRGIYVLFRM
jgi:hypothetical protein